MQATLLYSRLLLNRRWNVLRSMLWAFIASWVTLSIYISDSLIAIKYLNFTSTAGRIGTFIVCFYLVFWQVLLVTVAFFSKHMDSNSRLAITLTFISILLIGIESVSMLVFMIIAFAQSSDPNNDDPTILWFDSGSGACIIVAIMIAIGSHGLMVSPKGRRVVKFWVEKLGIQ